MLGLEQYGLAVKTVKKLSCAAAAPNIRGSSEEERRQENPHGRGRLRRSAGDVPGPPSAIRRGPTVPS